MSSVTRVGARGRAVRIDDDQHFGLGQLRRREDRAERRELARQAVVWRDDAMERPQRMRRLHHVGFGERRGANQLRRAVGRAAVGVDHDRAQARKIAREAQVNRANDVDDRRGIVERRQPDQDVDLADRHQLPEQRVGKGAFVLHGVVVTGIDLDARGVPTLSRSRSQPAQPEPIEVIRPHHHDVRLASDARKDAAAEHLDRNGAGQRGQIQLHDLSRARQVADDQHRLASERARERQHAMVRGLQELDRPAAEDLASSAEPR